MSSPCYYYHCFLWDLCDKLVKCYFRRGEYSIKLRIRVIAKDLKLMWDPTAILDGLLVLNYNAPTRAAVFFIGLGFGFAQVTSNVLANLISGGNDTAAFFPR